MENTGHFATFDAVVSLLQDLELIKSSPNYILDPNDCFSSGHGKEDIQILYDKISSLHSSFCNSSGLSYEKVLMDRWGHWIRFMVSLAQEYIESWVWSCIAPPNVEKESGRMSNPKLHRVAESMGFMNEQLKKIHVERDALRESTHNFRGATLTVTGQPFTVLDMSSRIPSPTLYTLDDNKFLSRRKVYSVRDSTIMYDNFREIQDYLRSKGEWYKRKGYERKMINNLERLIHAETRIAEDYMRVDMFIPEDPIVEMGDISTLDCVSQIIESTEFIKKQLKEIHDVRQILENPPRGKEGQSSTKLKFRRTFHVGNFGNEHYLPCPFRKGDVQVLYENLRLTRSFLIDSSGEVYDQKLKSRLEMWINDVADIAQDHLDAWVWSCLKKPNTEKPTNMGIYGAAQIFNRKLCQITDTTEFIHNQLKRSHDNGEVLRRSNQNVRDQISAGPSFIGSNMLPKTPNDECKLVGLEDDLIKMLDCLTRESSKLEVFAVTGMCGIGKTTFTKRLYDHPLVKLHFDIRAWFTISQHYQLREVLIGLLRCITDSISGLYGRDNAELMDTLYKSLKGMKYLIVLDDMWDKKVWDDLKTIFPNDRNDSRIILTSGLDDVAAHASQNTQCLRCLNDDESWELLYSKISMEELCPESQLIGKEIACKCQGLRLAIVVVGGLLSKMKKKLDVLKDVAQNVSSKVMKESNYCENVLALSYNHLPDHHLNMWINDVADIAQDYLDAWVWSCLKKPNIENPTNMGAAQIFNRKLCLITDTTELIHNQLKRSHDNGEVLRRSNPNVRDQISAGPSFIGSNMLPKTPNDECKLVGLKDDLEKMLDCLTRKSSKLEVFAVTGMGGIGKTTFTKKLYDHPLVKHHFDIRAWFTISQHYQLREVLIGLLRCITDSMTGLYERDNAELKDTLYKRLKGMRYLIVLDDMWDKKVWDDLKTIFPNDRNDSRIILTSRLDDVAAHASQNTHCLRCLNDDESWELLYSKLSMEELCPELQLIGKEIACKCQGLPLAIVVVGGLLSKMNKKLDVWKDVAQNVSSKVMKESNYCENTLALSYNHLPDHLKSCFLYVGTFPEDHKILAKKLIWLWIVEGFIRPENLKSVEEVAENYLEDLIARSLIQVKRKSSDGKIKICYIHDLLRDLCLIESYKQNFYLAFNKHGQLMKPANENYPMVLLEPRRICFPSSTPDLIISPLFPPIRSFLWFQAITLSDHGSYFFMNFKLLKVLDITYLNLGELPREISHMANLRYLALSFRKSIDRSIFSSTFHNIQFLIVEGEWNGLLPEEFWAMSELRHFYLKRSFLSYWPKESGPNIMQLDSTIRFPQDLICQVQYQEHSLKVLQNLQSLGTIRPISCTKAIFLSMPNLKKLRVYENEEDYGFRGWFNNLIHLKELQTLKYVFRDPFVSGFMKPVCLPSPDFFPQKLTNLTLSGTSFPWEDMLKLSALPVLEVLKLENYAFAGALWQSKGSGFPRLRYIFIGRTNLQVWEADGSHFPRLKHLVIMNCRLLKEIPCGIGELPLLEKIELCNCSESASASAEQILLEQQSYANDSLIVHIM